MRTCNERGHTVYFLEPNDINIDCGQVIVRMRTIPIVLRLSKTPFINLGVPILYRNDMLHLLSWMYEKIISD